MCVCVGIGDPKLARAEVPLGMGPYSSKLLANKLIGQERERERERYPPPLSPITSLF